MATKVDITETSISASQMTEFFRLASLSGHVNRETFQAYLERRNPFEPKSSLALASTEKFVIEIPPNLTIAQMVELGKYNWANEYVVKRSESDPSLAGSWECELVDPKKSISSEQANKLCEEDGWMVAKADHLLMFGATYPELQRQNWIVGLGSSVRVDGDRDVPVLSGDDSERYLFLYYWSSDWCSDFCFLRVRKLSA